MIGLDLAKLEAWCQDAVTLLPTPGLPASITEMRRETIRRHSGAKPLFDIAADLAEGLSHLPSHERSAAQGLLTERYGFGHELFTDAKLKRVRAVLKRGRVQNEAEYAELLDAAGDTTLASVLRDAVVALIAGYEAARAKPV